MITWQWRLFQELPAEQLYALLSTRSAVFVVEQRCAYQDMDGLDLGAEHLIGWAGTQIAAYLRLLKLGTSYAELSLGRILTTTAFRGSGIGRQLLEQALAHVDQRYTGHAIRIGAQAHLQKFYGEFGFRTVSDVYMEDGIAHVTMLRPPRIEAA